MVRFRLSLLIAGFAWSAFGWMPRPARAADDLPAPPRAPAAVPAPATAKPEAPGATTQSPAANKSPAEAAKQAQPSAEGMSALDPNRVVLLDRKGKRLLVKTHVVLREGLLEMLCCPAHTKEHESILSVDAPAFVIHTGLLALGAQPGSPVQFRPEFKPPTGQRIEIYLNWTDAKRKSHRVRAQDWIRTSTHRIYAAPLAKLPPGIALPQEDDALPIRYHAKFKELSWYGPMSVAQRHKLLALGTDKDYHKAIEGFYASSRVQPLKADWVFAGSGFFVDPQTGDKQYLAEGGDLICVSNFPSAMLDLDVRSTDRQEEGLLFEPWTERVPPRGTEVTMEMVPVFPPPAK